MNPLSPEQTDGTGTHATREAPPLEGLYDADQHALAQRVLRKTDWRLIPLMFITYNLNFMDKTILSSASVFGLREDTVSTADLQTVQSSGLTNTHRV